MDSTTEETVTKILEMLRALPWMERGEAMIAIRYNGEFCQECGWNDPNCQCSNDE